MTTSNQSSTKQSPPRLLNFWFLATGIFSFLGFADATYLTVGHYLTLPLPCTLTHGCEAVLTSRFATVGGLPIALLGAIYYLFILFLTLYLYTSDNPKMRIARLVTLVTGIGLIVSCYLLYLQLAVIHALCMYCLGSATTTFLLFISSLFLVRSFRTAA
jgi:uncharacterized membrane protein